MSATPTTSSGNDGIVITGGQSHKEHRSRRLWNFLLPDGKEVHIALSHEEAESLRKRLEAIKKDEPFELVISGSPEHLDALKRAHSHHEQRRQFLRDRHGEAYDEFENVRAELDVIGSELHMLTDHAVALDANFSKYGYSAHLRTYDEDSPESSARSSISGLHGPDHESKDWAAERTNGSVMKIYKKASPRATARLFFSGLLLFFNSGEGCTNGLSSLLSGSTFIKDCSGGPVDLPRQLLLSCLSIFCM